MYLHLGQSVVVPHRDIIGIFDLDNTSSSYLTRAFLEQAERKKEVINVSEELPKAFVLCCPQPQGRQAVYLSQLSPATLLRRAESNRFEEQQEESTVPPDTEEGLIDFTQYFWR